MSANWSPDENRLIVDDYLDMLEQELRGLRPVKSEHRRRLLPRLHNRTKSSVEMKRQNISAILIERRLPYVRGYAPLSKYQRLLADVVDDRLVRLDPRVVEAAAAAEVESTGQVPALTESAPPKPALPDPAAGHLSNPWSSGRARQIDFVGAEGRNRALGTAGEAAVFAFERARLADQGRRDLVDRVIWASRDRGDGLGYDIQSFNQDGTERWIEVKTTRQGPYMPFLVTRNEVACSEDQPGKYHLYRLFDFGSDSRLFVLRGSLPHMCRLSPRVYEARAG